MVFTAAEAVYVRLESYRFDDGIALTRGSGYLRQADELQARDQAAL